MQTVSQMVLTHERNGNGTDVSIDMSTLHAHTHKKKTAVAPSTLNDRNKHRCALVCSGVT